jgi:hypothetical protein
MEWEKGGGGGNKYTEKNYALASYILSALLPYIMHFTTMIFFSKESFEE